MGYRKGMIVRRGKAFCLSFQIYQWGVYMIHALGAKQQNGRLEHSVCPKTDIFDLIALLSLTLL